MTDLFCTAMLRHILPSPISVFGAPALHRYAILQPFVQYNIMALIVKQIIMVQGLMKYDQQ